jgi:hypothetical protein
MFAFLLTALLAAAMLFGTIGYVVVRRMLRPISVHDAPARRAWSTK